MHSFAKHSGNGPSISPLASTKPPTGEMLSYQLNNGCAYKKGLELGWCFVSNLRGVRAPFGWGVCVSVCVCGGGVGWGGVSEISAERVT